ncbi:MAG: alginate biosynthesis protein Alg44 [Gammaproteobacteria bacterium]
MNTVEKIHENTNIVHESEAQRQYARVQMPLVLETSVLETSGLEASESGGGTVSRKRYTLHDISAGGFSLQNTNSAFAIGRIYEGVLLAPIDGFTLSLEVSFQVRNSHTTGARMGFEFQNLGPKAVSALRYLITSFLSGELVRVGDMLNTLSRENFTKARQTTASKTSMGGKLKAVVGSVAFLAAGLTAAGFVMGQLYNHFLVTTSNTGKLVVETYKITMPREGIVQPLVAPGASVKRGESVATFVSPMMDFLSTEMADAIDPETITLMSDAVVKGTLVSPCDCNVMQSFVGTGQYRAKGEPVFALSDRESMPYVMAAFDFKSADALPLGTAVNVRILGEDRVYTGKITQLQVPGDEKALSQTVEARVVLDQGPLADALWRPVKVYRSPDLSGALISKVVAATE